MAEAPVWPVQDAKARFSELLDTCLTQGPQTISRRGVPEAVLMSLDDWRHATAPRATLKELLTQDTARFILDLPARGQGRHREIDGD
ncbi:MAG: type II toxin-antitoxin system Phd/YefM family antitoxin [Propionibacteriaceae bacterium]|nr:type II toxin-antitoxin system Phd/YefM family antitoxin [Propionibacteriaceae bacterium]